MKIRIQGNSIRLRLSQTDIQKFDRDKILTQSVQFPGGHKLLYQIKQTSDALVSARFDPGSIAVTLPEKEAQQWIHSEQVGVSRNLPLESGDQLVILVEKDFQCLNPRPGEDERDAFPNPQANDS